MSAYKCSGDLGDLVAALCVIRHLGRGHIRMDNTPGTKGFTAETEAYITPLIATQPYCESVKMFDPEECLEITHDATGFRQSWGKAKLLHEKIAVHLGLNLSDVDFETPWLTNIPDAPKHRKIAVVRSERNLGYLHSFKLLQVKHRDCEFLGLPQEHELLMWNTSPAPGCKHPYAIPLHRTKDAVEAAQFLLGSRLVVSNPTLFLWMAAGLGCPNILVEASQEDSMFHRAGIRNVRAPQENPTLREFQGM